MKGSWWRCFLRGGASRTEAEDLVADLWADCFTTAASDRSLLGKYQGRSSLESWLMTVAMHRLVDLKRRQMFRGELPALDSSAESFFNGSDNPRPASSEETLLDLLREAVRQAFSKTSADEMLLLKLVHFHRLTQREVGRMWGWHESKVSRTLETARDAIARNVLSALKQSDPWLELRWEDFLELCERSPDLFPKPREENSQTPSPHQSKLERQVPAPS